MNGSTTGSAPVKGIKRKRSLSKATVVVINSDTGIAKLTGMNKFTKHAKQLTRQTIHTPKHGK